VVGAMNTAAQTGSLVSSLAFGQLVPRFGDYNLPFIPMAALCTIGAFLWLKVDPTRRLVPAPAPCESESSIRVESTTMSR